MNTASSNFRAFEPGDTPDLLAGGLLNSLGRASGGYGAWRPLRTLLIGGITFGIAPAFFWPRKFRKFVTIEREQLWHLAEWMRLRTGSNEAAELRAAADRIRFRIGLWIVSLLAVAAVIVAFFVRYEGVPDIGALLGATYNRLPARLADELDLMVNQQFNFIWTMGLTLAFALHWLQVRLHALDVRRFVETFERVAHLEQVAPLSRPALGIGIRPLWIAAALVLMALGALWALPMMLAGAAHRRYITRTSDVVRGQLADRVRELLLRNRPAMRVVQPVWMRQTCANEMCQMALPQEAKFCPRCGTRAEARVNAVA